MTVEELNNVKGRAWEDVDVSVLFRCFTTQNVQSAYMWCNSIEPLLLVRWYAYSRAGTQHSGTSDCVPVLRMNCRSERRESSVLVQCRGKRSGS